VLSTSFIAVDSTGPGAYRAVFKAKMGTDDVIATRTSAPGQPTSIMVSTQTAGTDLDAQAPAGSLVSAIGIERDGLRNGRLALAASMLNETTGEAWAGIYFTTLPPVDTCPADLDGDGEVDAHDLAELLDSWGSCDELPADLNGDGAVDAIDLAILLSAWGECP
jgi:Dockerin type I domain